MYPRRTSSGTLSGDARGRETQDGPCPSSPRSNGPPMGGHLSGGLAAHGEDFPGLFRTISQRKRESPWSEGRKDRRKGEPQMMSRFCRYIEKVFDFGERVRAIHDTRQKPRIPTSAIWMSAFFMFVMRRGSLNAIESELRVPKRFDRLIGPDKPSADRMGDVFGLIPSEELRAMLSGINHQLGRNKVFGQGGPWRFVTLDGHEFFSQSTSLLYGVFSAEGEGSWRRSDRILPPGRGLSFDRIRHGRTPGCGDAPAWGRRDHCSPTPLRACA